MNQRNKYFKIILVLVSLTNFAFVKFAYSAGPVGKIENVDFSFEGVFGTYDKNQLQRGLQVFTEVCAGCHGLTHVAYRNLGDPGGPELPPEQVKAYAAQFDIYDSDLDDDRSAVPSDYFSASMVENAPNLSLIAKARAGGAEYIVSLLKSYTEEEKEQAGSVLYGNKLYPGGWIAMSQPLYGDDVEYMDGTEATLKQEAEDVAAFLMWAAEPKLNVRKETGFKAVLLLLLLSVLLYLTNKKLWAPFKNKKYN
ncbi:cytochrome c1 [Paracoccaceae bacterium]|nr:cytochrome c1 [Paracoccaceae bacterium]